MENIAPSYDSDGSVGQVVVELKFPPFSGTFQLPGKRLLEVGEEKYQQRVYKQYLVEGLEGVYVGIDIESGNVVWANLSYSSTGNTNVITSVEVLSTSQTDHKGRQIPTDARPVTFED